MFDRSRIRFGAPEGGSGGAALPRFQPMPGGFGKRQVPVGARGAQGDAAPVAHESVADESGSSEAGTNETGAGAPAKAARRAASNDNPPAAAPVQPFGSDAAIRLEQWLSREFRHVRDVPCETTLTVAGALTGFAAQHGIWEALVRSGKMAIQQAFVVIETRSGETFFFGDLLNEMLVAPDPARPTVWKIVGGAARALGAEELPELTPIFKHSAETVGTGSFGLPLLPEGHLPNILPRDALNRYWPEARRILCSAGDPLGWALDAAMAARQLMLGMKGRIDPALAARVVMEAAVPMSRVDPMTVPKD